MGLDPTPQQIINQLIQEEGEKYDLRQDKQNANESATKPDKFLTPRKWRIFKDGFRTYTHSIRGISNIPLAYVIRPNNEATAGITFHNETEQAVATAPLRGGSYMADNEQLFGLLLSLVLEGPGYYYVKAFEATRNGRGAWLALMSHYEGRAFRENSINEAYSTIENSCYIGETQNFSFEQYITLYQGAYTTLEEYNENVNEEKRVCDFLRNINCNKLASAVNVVRATERFASNFTETANFLS